MAPIADVMTDTPPAPTYKVACLALDLTGRKLIDEICHFGAFSYPDKSFSQHVMPHRDISSSASRTFGIKIFTNFGRYRVLKDMKTMKTLKTKSEYSTLTDFIDWLKDVKGTADGVLLAFHDNRNEAVTPFLMEALERYKMTDDFFNVVKGFVCAQAVAEDHLEEESETKSKPVTLKALAKRFLELDDNGTTGVFHSAKDRAQIIYQLLQKILNQDSEINTAGLVKYATTQLDEMNNLEKQREMARKVRSLRPVFASKIRANMKERNRAVSLRKYLIDAHVDFEDLTKAYETGEKDAVTEVVSKTQAQKKEKDMEDLVQMIVTFFKDDGSSAKNRERDMNGNTVKRMGQGDGQPNGASTSSTDTDEEFEEAKDRIEISPTK